MKKKKRKWVYPVVLLSVFGTIGFFFWWYSDARLEKIEIPYEKELMITKEQKYQDFDYLTSNYEKMSANYLVDKDDMDIEYVKKNSRAFIGETTSVVDSIVAYRYYRFQNFSFNSIVSPFRFLDIVPTHPDKEPESSVAKYFDAVDGLKLANQPYEMRFARDEALVKSNITYAKFLKAINIERGIETLPVSKLPREIYMDQNQKLTENKIQYIRIHSFDDSPSVIVGDSTQKESYEDIIKGLSDNKGIIIDLRACYSGDSSTFRNKFLKNIINEPISLVSYAGRRDFEDSSFENDFLKLTKEDRATLADANLMRKKYADIAVEKIDSLPESMKNINKEDLSELKHLYKITDSLQKTGNGFKGKIVVVADNQTFGEAENIVRIMKKMDNVTFIGQRTSGEGSVSDIGLQKIVMPNSKLLYKLQTLYGFNDDGSSNFKKGLDPDIETDYQRTLDGALEFFGIK